MSCSKSPLAQASFLSTQVEAVKNQGPFIYSLFSRNRYVLMGKRLSVVETFDHECLFLFIRNRLPLALFFINTSYNNKEEIALHIVWRHNPDAL